MTYQLSGVIHGKTIELNADPGLNDGQAVTVVVEASQVAIVRETRPWGEGIRASSGAFSDEPNADELLDRILQARKAPSRRETFE